MDLIAWKKELGQLVMEVLADKVEEEAVELEEAVEEEKGDEEVKVRDDKPKTKYGKKGNTKEKISSDSDEDGDFKKSTATRRPSKIKKRNTLKDDQDNSTSKKPKLPTKGGFMAMLQLSPDLADIVGENKMQRHEVT